jgi:hypothetical protein
MSTLAKTALDFKKLMLASLFSLPAKDEEFFKRDFLKNTSREGLERLLMQMEVDGWIYYRGETMHAYKAAVAHYIPEALE